MNLTLWLEVAKNAIPLTASPNSPSTASTGLGNFQKVIGDTESVLLL